MRGFLFAGAILGAVAASAQIPPPASRYQTELNRLEAMSSVPLPEWRHHAADLPHPEDPSLDDANWTSVALTAANAPGWYRRSIEIPRAAGGKEIRGARVDLVLRLSGMSRVFVNGSMVAQGNGRLVQPIQLAASAVPGERLLVAVNTSRLSEARLSIHDSGIDPAGLRSAILSTEALLSGFPDPARQAQLDTAVRKIDFAALDRGDQQAFVSSVDRARRDLQPLHDWMRQFSVLAVGNSHIDMAWLWPWTETVEVVRDTYSTALQLMREYPRFTYTQSSAQTFEWLEEKYPDLFHQIQSRVKEGRWEMVGGMWVEPDLNMPDGEGLVRQLLVGTRYFKQKFGVDINIGWNPDSFGYNWQLPQIYKKSGFDYFVTQKMSWNETTVFPYKLFWWQAPDGSRVLTYFPHRYDNGIDAIGIAKDLADYAPATRFSELMHLYGVGDHGGGPTRAMLDEVVRLQDPSVTFPPISFSTPHVFFSDLQKSVDSGEVKPPVWNDELYLEYHRGCYTTQSETKKQIRESEQLLQDAEKFASFSFLGGHSYPHKVLESSWKKVLFDHFHDIMPGSGIAVNYVDAARDLREVGLEGDQILHEALGDLAARAKTAGSGAAVVVFNPLSWERTEPVVVEARFPTAVGQLEVHDAAGKPLLFQVITSEGDRVKLRVLVPRVPPLGYEVIHVVPVKNRRAVPTTLKVTGTTLENEFLRLAIDPHSGCITSLVNKADGRESVAPGGCGNLLQTFVDKPPKQDAWEIKFDEQFWDLKQPQEVKVVESGPVRAVVRVTHKFQSSTFVQDISISAGVPRVDVDMQADWHEQHILLKVGFPVDVQTKVATYEIPYGTIQRPTTRDTPAEKAKFEVPALRWGDLSDESHGLSLLNASKYGYDAKGNVIRLSLLRAATYPGANGECCTDQGFHEFRYALYPHKGDWETGGTMRQGYALNYPLIPLATGAHGGPLPARHSFAGIANDNAILTVVKKAEDDDALIFRFYEFAGRKSSVRLQLPDKATGAFETNLMEKQERAAKLEADGREVVIPTGPYEIKTVKVFFPH
jgi:alpha-mannosidase